MTFELQELSRSTNQVALDVQKDITLVKDTASTIHSELQETKIIAVATQQDTKENKETTMKVHTVVHSQLKIEQERKENLLRETIRSWLKAPDPSSTHNRSTRLREKSPGSGSWFLQGKEFAHWKEQASFIWLYGKPGCGKTVLSSTIINELQSTAGTQANCAIAYFYFDFNDFQKQGTESLIRSLITQFEVCSQSGYPELSDLYADCQKGLNSTGYRPIDGSFEEYTF